MEKEALKLGVKNSNVKFLGWQNNNPGEFYSKADAFCCPRILKVGVMVVVEASSYGLSVIMTDVGCAEN